MGVSDERIALTGFSRQDVLRILRIRAKHLRDWERCGLIAYSESYSIQHMVQLRKLRDLRATRLTAASIRASVHAMQSVSGMINPLLEAGAVRTGSRLAFRHSGAMVDPIARQFVFDFDMPKVSRLAQVNGTTGHQVIREDQVQRLFFQAVQLEERSNSEEAMAVYERILSLDEGHAPACINLGTIHYNRREFTEAESLYRRATVSDPHYALAFFDLGNVLDEMQRLPEAIGAYQSAIALTLHYADAHYNLALALERMGERRQALRHWRSYIRLDPIGPWATHARGQMRKILEREKLAIVYRNTPVRPL